jgi:hypothetical protein
MMNGLKLRCGLLMMLLGFVIRVQPIAAQSTGYVFAVAWSPDGNVIAYSEGIDQCFLSIW